MAERMKDEDLVGLVNQEFENAMGSPGGEISRERAEAWRYYLSEKFGNEIEGQSEVVTSDVSDVVDGIMPSLLRIFTTADNLVSFDPVSPEDEEAAEQESDYVNYVFFKQNPSFEILFNWCFDGLAQKNGITKAWWDDKEDITTESYEGLSEEELLELLGDDELEPVERDERQAETVDESGQVVFQTVHDVTFKRVSKQGQVRVESVPPEEYRISSDARSLDPSGARMVGQERMVTRSELLAMGFDKKVVDELPSEREYLDTEEKASRRSKIDDQRLGKESNDRSQDEIRLREAYVKVDADGDGRSELMQIFAASGKLLEKSPVDRQPFHVICPHPLPHKHFGRSTAEKVKDIQLISSTLMRQILDNLYHTNNPGHAVWEQAMGENTLDDLLTTRAGSIKRFARPIDQGAYQPITVPFMAKESFPMVEHFDKIKRDRTGIRSDSEGLSPDQLKNIQQSVMMQATDLAKMKVEAIARIFAETGFKSLFRHIHELVMKHQQKAQVVRLRNQWVKVNPKEWKTRKDMTVKIGLGIGTREQNLLHLDAIWQKQSEMAERGGLNLTVTPRNFWNTAAEIVKNANLKNPEDFFTDPGDRMAPPPSDEQMQLQQQQQQLEARRQELDAQKRELDQMKLQLQAQDQQRKHEREMLEQERKREKDKDDLLIAMEQIRTKLTELELNAGQNIPGSKV